ncbi:MAG: hypothetical protein ABUK15_07320 [Anaerolineales bacterium]
MKTWIAGEVLSAADLNAEFNNPLNNALSLISPLTGALDFDGKELILDADGDTSITSDTDDQIDIRVGGADDFKITANLFDVLAGSKLKVTGVMTWTKGADVASASDLLVGIDGNIFDVTGTTQVDTIATKGVGTYIILHFDGAVVLAHDATNLVIPGGANYTTAAGDEFLFYEYATADWRCAGYALASGASIVTELSSDTTPQLGGDLDLNGNNIDFPTTANISDCLDEDDMTSDSATMLATQQSIKAYVDANLTPDASKAPPEISNNGVDAAKDIDFAAGYCRAENTVVKITNTAMTKQLDASWAAGSAAGGLTSSLHPLAAAATTVHCFAVLIGGSTDFLFDTDIDCTNGIADHTVTAYRRLGSILTDATPDILAFSQNGDEFLWKDPPRDINLANTLTTTARTDAISVPTGIKVNALMNVTVADGTVETAVYISSPDANDEAPSISVAPLSTIITQVIDKAISTPHNVRTDTSAQIRARASAANINSYIVTTIGWIDPRGRNA